MLNKGLLYSKYKDTSLSLAQLARDLFGYACPLLAAEPLLCYLMLAAIS
jgi:hypothetical protein